MKRITEFWFEFKGVLSTTMKVLMTGMPIRPHPAERGEQAPAAGRSGDLWIPDGGYDGIIVRVPCATEDDANIDVVNAWLSGAGDLRFSDEPDRVYRARITKEFSRSNQLPRFANQAFTPSFDCYPLRYKRLATEGADDVELTESGGNVTNPGTVASEPKITIEGSGDFVVFVNAQMMTFTGISGGIIVDSEAGDCFSLDMSELLNNNADFDEFPLLAVGANVISWTGTVTKVTIRPRTRYL